MKIRIAMACIALVLCASIACADDPRSFTARVTYAGGSTFSQFWACYGVRFVVNGTTYTLVQGGSSVVEVGPVLAPFTEGSTLNYTFMNFNTSNCSTDIPELGRGSLVFRNGATGGFYAPVKVADKMSVSYKVELQPSPIASLRKWLITFNIKSDEGYD